ncbi:MAG: hypothetical protein DRJ38_02155 [Thermoprotei archaeon]|nr:MAG: hypothetical protein DRJ38_02155 [Thermoprotei archaeon]
MIDKNAVGVIVRVAVISIAVHAAMKLFPFYPGFAQLALYLVICLLSFKHPRLALIAIWLGMLPAVAYYSPGLALLHLILTIPLGSLIRQHWFAGALYIILVSLSITEQFMGQFLAAVLIASALFFQPLTAALLGFMYSSSVLALITWLFPAGIVNRGFILARAEGLVLHPKPALADLNIGGYLTLVFSNAAIEQAATLLETLYLNLLSYGVMPLSLIAAFTLAPYTLASLGGRDFSKWKIAATSLVASGVLAAVFSATAYTIFSMPIDLDFYVPFIFMTLAFSLTAGSIAGIVHKIREEEMFSTKLTSMGLFVPVKSQKISFDDIGGLEEVKAQLYESIILPLKKNNLAKKFKLSIPKGILLFGPPGCGKTLIMKALASQLRMKFIHVKCSDIMSKWYGESEQKLARLFTLARRESPCVLFFDEIDAIAKKRDAYSTDDVAPRLLSIILSEMDGMEPFDGVLVVGATNMPEVLDPAILRPGRFDKVIYVPPPDKKAREKIFKIHCKGLPLASDVDFSVLAEMTERFSGADIAAVVKEASRRALKDSIKGRSRLIGLGDFIAVIKKFKPSITYEMLEKYEKFRMDYERIKSTSRRTVLMTPIKLDNVIGLENVKTEILDTILIPLKHSHLLEKYRIRQAKGILLFGPPGCGKTMLARALASELKVEFIEVQCSDITSGENPELNLKKVFSRARENAPAILFLDEIDALAPSRIGSSERSRRLIAQLLIEMDGIRNLKNVVVLAATNRPSSLDPALLRPGRFDKILYVPPPNREARIALFKKELADTAVENLNYEALADLTKGYSAADIVYICNEAKMKAAKRSLSGGEPEVTFTDLITIIEATSPSITDEMLAEYYDFYIRYKRPIQISNFIKKS